MSIKNILFLVGVSFGMSAYEIHLYSNYYFHLSFIGSLFIYMAMIINRENLKDHPKMGHILLTNALMVFLPISLLYQIMENGYMDYSFLLKTASIILVINIVYFAMSQRDLRSILHYCFVITFPLAILNIAIFIEGRVLFWDKVDMRGASVFFDPNYFAVFNALAIFYVAILQRNRLVYRSVILAILTLSIYFTFSKTGLFALLISFITYVIIKKMKKGEHARLLLYSALAFVSLMVAFPYFMKIPSANLFRFYMGLGGRLELWRMGIAAMREDILGLMFGRGILIDTLSTSASFHNYIIEYTIFYGILFMIPILGVCTYAFLKYMMKSPETFFLFLLMFLFSNLIVISIGGMSILSLIFSICFVMSYKYETFPMMKSSAMRGVSA